MNLNFEARHSPSLDMQVYRIGHGKDSSLAFFFPKGELRLASVGVVLAHHEAFERPLYLDKLSIATYWLIY